MTGPQPIVDMVTSVPVNVWCQQHGDHAGQVVAIVSVQSLN